MSKENGLKNENKQAKATQETRAGEKRWTATRKQEVVLRLLRGEARLPNPQPARSTFEVRAAS